MQYAPSAASPPWRFRLIALTLLSLLVVVVVLVRAATARMRDTTARAQLLRELGRLDDQQAAWDARHGTFAGQLGTTENDTTLAFTPTPGVDLRFEAAIPGGWSAIVTTDRLRAAPRQCGIYRGPPAAAPHRALIAPGQVVCW
ncbi:MAG: hypothetical protein IPP98_02515 [Gemmatimonadetes bacterium]|nr:hypothetical protein [Gemmatimonadota bacterium]